MAAPVQTVDYGKWTSPITAELLSDGSIHLEGVETRADNLYVLESRPGEGGRYAITEISGSTARDVLPAEYSAMSTVHEYGGGSYATASDGTLIFTNHPTNGVFSLDPGSGIVKTIVSPNSQVRFGNLSVGPASAKWILAVRETHDGDLVTNTAVAIDSQTGIVTTLVEGADFYQHVQFSPDGKKICWTEWNHPDMPWTGTVLYTADWEEGQVSKTKSTAIFGKAGTESICQPRWGPDGTLFFVADRTGYWQLYRLNPGTATPCRVLLEGLETSEFGIREPRLGNCTYVLLDKSTMIASVTHNATSNLVVIDLDNETYKDLNIDLVDIQQNAMARLSPTSFAVIGGSRRSPQALYRVDLSEGISVKPVRTTFGLSIPDQFLSSAEHISFPRAFGKNRAGLSHAMFIPPKNPNFKAPAGSKPPLLLWMHGGPTSHVPPSLSLSTQYWTSRGYAYVLVNHAGSTGYGRAYRELLDGEWGVADVADAASCVKYLVSESLVDAAKVGIVGESAGGYAVLQAAYMYPDIWTAGISLYGISNLKGFAETTHKFESHYLFGLVLRKGLTPEEVDAIYMSRSACYHADRIKAPLLLLQGAADTVVPEVQARQCEEVMHRLGKPIEVVVFEGEGHGWHKKETIREALELQTRFWTENLIK